MPRRVRLVGAMRSAERASTFLHANKAAPRGGLCPIGPPACCCCYYAPVDRQTQRVHCHTRYHPYIIRHSGPRAWLETEKEEMIDRGWPVQRPSLNQTTNSRRGAPLSRSPTQTPPLDPSSRRFVCRVKWRHGVWGSDRTRDGTNLRVKRKLKVENTQASARGGEDAGRETGTSRDARKGCEEPSTAMCETDGACCHVTSASCGFRRMPRPAFPRPSKISPNVDQPEKQCLTEAS